MTKLFVIFSGVFGALAVVIGALAAHGLKSRLTDDALGSLDLASKYMLLHAGALFACAAFNQLLGGMSFFRYAGGFYVLGVILFCGGLALAALTGQRFWSTLAPFGGTALIIAWSLLVVAAIIEL
ncbi:MAG: DUF423 domain-containing protein [Pseudomonadota bacterium]